MTVVLQTEGLTKSYGSLTAVNDLSLLIHEGEIFGFLGPNGAGKTTSILMMCGLLKPDKGRVFIYGNLVKGGSQDVRARIGVCPQEIVLWEKLTCLEQLEFMGELYGMQRQIARQRAGELLGILGLSSHASVLAGKLSGGMRRRLNLALGLIHDPGILVLDEHEAGLDPQSRVLVREYLRSLARRKTIILTTHNMDEADRLADRVAIIDHGQLLVVDTPVSLKKTLGEGDVLELETWPDEIRAETIVRRYFQDVSSVNHTLTIRGRDILERLPGVLASLREAGIETDHIQLRTNTLEDVFLSLTGRRLRE